MTVRPFAAVQGPATRPTQGAPAEAPNPTDSAMELKMPWTADQPPPSMRNLPPKVRRKAVEIANALLRERMDEAKAIRIVTAKARAWALEQEHRSERDEPA